MLPGLYRHSLGCLAVVVFAFGSPQSGFAAPALKPSAKELQDKQLSQRLAVVEEKMRGLFERVKIGKEPVSELIAVIEEFGRLKRALAATPEKRVDVALMVLRQLVITESQMKALMAAGLQTKEAVDEVGAARERAAELVRSLAGEP